MATGYAGERSEPVVAVPNIDVMRKLRLLLINDETPLN